ncbi:hypothetical protein [Solitalea lacus]|uniref:hypothetical protein n=1 Tax=Solitalea lacus TaxID=2911172 RepID=UPI001EDB3DDD|nr:hypothetical protein [Solitalea lacus]UKJ06491.1 hypothetical protein L2B55_13220 [Solitalea lacus]
MKKVSIFINALLMIIIVLGGIAGFNHWPFAATLLKLSLISRIILPFSLLWLVVLMCKAKSKV